MSRMQDGRIEPCINLHELQERESVCLQVRSRTTGLRAMHREDNMERWMFDKQGRNQLLGLLEINTEEAVLNCERVRDLLGDQDPTNDPQAIEMQLLSARFTWRSRRGIELLHHWWWTQMWRMLYSRCFPKVSGQAPKEIEERKSWTWASTTRYLQLLLRRLQVSYRMEE